jgi:G3E family GTPase
LLAGRLLYHQSALILVFFGSLVKLVLPPIQIKPITMTPETRIPITLLTGFLGSGKTTLLNYLLRHRTDKKIAVIENEFANYDFDSALVDANAVAVESVSNGCICCEQSSALAEALLQLSAEPNTINHVIIEATGVAFPGEIVAAILNSEAAYYFYIDAVLCLADATSIKQRLADTAEAVPQLAIADVVLLTKTDLAAPEMVAAAIAQIGTINPFAMVHHCTFGHADAGDLLHQKLLHAANSQQQLLQLTEQPGHSAIKSMVFEFEDAFDFLKLNFFLNAASSYLGNNLYRIKGIVHAAGEPHRMLLQSAGQQHTWAKAAVWASEKPFTKIVFIGKGLNRAELQHHLTDCFDGQIDSQLAF